jgi:hypothetical protein
MPVDSGTLATWETSGLQGQYTLKLSAYDQIGHSLIYCQTINLNNTITPTKEPEPQPGLPLTFALPNPFSRSAGSSEATINYTLSGNFDTRIYLFDLSGNLIWQKSYYAGENGGKSGANNPAWNTRDLYGAEVTNGLYLYQVVADNRVIARGKLIILN